MKGSVYVKAKGFGEGLREVSLTFLILLFLKLFGSFLFEPPSHFL